MYRKSISILSATSLFTGMLLFALQREWIVIRSPLHSSQEKQLLAQYYATKKTATIFYWHTHQWQTENQELIWTESKARNMQYLIASWLNLLEEENILDKKVIIQSVTLSPSEHEAYLSFDRNPLHKEKTTFEKWMLIEGLLRTIRENNIPIQNINILVRHQPLQDPHLDFSNSWPLSGFIN